MAFVDYSLNVQKYVPVPDTAAVSGIVRYLGIALRRAESSAVASTDPTERTRLRESFLKRRLKLDLPDDELDAAVADVLSIMGAERAKSRVTVCYLLAHRFNKLPLFLNA